MDSVARTKRTGNEYGSVETAESPTRRRRVAGLDLLIVDGFLDAAAVRIERAAGNAHGGELKDDISGAISLAGAERPAIESAGSEIFAHRPVKESESLRDKFVDSFRGYEKKSPGRTAVELGMNLDVAGDAEGGDIGRRDRSFEDAASGDIDL
jgi:hypothetical protein